MQQTEADGVRRSGNVQGLSVERSEGPGSLADPLEVVAAFGAAWADHDLEATLALVSDDCVFDATGPAPDGTEWVGKPRIRDAWDVIFSEPSSRFEPEETFAAGDRVVQRWRYSWDGGHVRGVDLFRVWRGRITEKRSYVKG